MKTKAMETIVNAFEQLNTPTIINPEVAAKALEPLAKAIESTKQQK